MSNERIYRSIHGATFLCAAACGAMPVFAAEGVGDLQVEEIIVTANRRESNLQDTAVAVTAFSQTTLDQAQASDLAGLQAFVPNLTV
jgi:iron complex outermembrane receptor protein